MTVGTLPTPIDYEVVDRRARLVVRCAPIEAALDRAKLPPAERVASDSMPPLRQAAFVAARVLLRSTLAELLGGRPETWDITVAPSGALRLGNPEGVTVNVSHCASHVAAAVAFGARVGVDVQHIVSVDPALVRRHCGRASDHLLELVDAGARDRAFVEQWAVKEACLKAIGQGLRTDPRDVEVAIGARHDRWQEVAWWLLAPDPGPDVVAAVAMAPLRRGLRRGAPPHPRGAGQA